jgi:prepilin-type N-terminal cleavage/methylation domain-containing protein
MASPPDNRNSTGFTLMEVLVVVVLIAVFAVVVVTVLRDHNAARQIAAGDVLAAHIRYAQMRSMDSGASWGIRYDHSQNTYWMYRNPYENIPKPLPGETADSVALETGITLDSSFTVRFDDWGRPCNSTDLLSGNLTLNIAISGRATLLPLTIVANTGFVQWQP